MRLDIGPLRRNLAFRHLFAQPVHRWLGHHMVSLVTVPCQYQVTHPNAQIGLLGIVQRVPMIVCGLLGGVVADRMDRRRLLLGSEALMALCLVDLLTNACNVAPSILAIDMLVSILQGAGGFHRPATARRWRR